MSSLEPEPPSLGSLFRRVRQEGDCWIWTGAKDGKGYGNVGRMRKGQRKNWIVHRLVYEHVIGPIPAGMDVHHTCEQKLCLRPDHLEAVTRREHQGRDGRHPQHMDAAIRASIAARKARREARGA